MVLVGPKEALLTAGMEIKELNWLTGDIPSGGLEIGLKFRSTQMPVMAKIYKGKAGTARIMFKNPDLGISPGQAAVCYAGTRVLGGGWITKALPADLRLQGEAAE